jgi:hypothetical protein
LKATHRIAVSGPETIGAINTGFDTVSLHRLAMGMSMGRGSWSMARHNDSTTGHISSMVVTLSKKQGLKLVHLSAQPEPFLIRKHTFTTPDTS